MKRVFYRFFIVLILTFISCSSIIDPENSGSVQLVLISGRIGKILSSINTGNSLRRVSCRIERRGSVYFNKDLELQGDYFKGRINNLDVGIGYEIFLLGYGSSSRCDVCSYRDGINIKKGYVTSVTMEWIKFVSELVSPVNGEIADSSVICFSWRKVSCASDYYLQVDDDSLFVSPSVSVQLSDTSYAWKINSYKKTYYWRVVCQSGKSNGEWSETGNFRYVPSSGV
ncbi:hypothetical protein J7K93_10085 [bacterium]|nr:hypothetical protein [bacterium]